MRVALTLALLVSGTLSAADLILESTVGKPFTYQPHFQGADLHYTAEGLPAGVSIHPTTGEVKGTWLTPGRHAFVITAKNSVGKARHPVVVWVADTGAAAVPVTRSPPPPPVAKGEEEDTPDPMLASGNKLAPWTENQRRVIHHWFLPGAAGLPAGDWYYRISHVAREGYDRSPTTNLLGLDDSVKIGLMLGWSPVKSVTVTLQRSNGRDLAVDPVDGQNVQYDIWEPLVQWQILDQRGVRGGWSGPCDLSVMAGESLMVRNHGLGDTSLDLGLMAERDLLNDRLRLGIGVVRAGLSSYEKPISKGAPVSDKRFPDEQDYLASQGSAVERSAASTVAVPLTARLAVAEHWFLIGEAVLPVAGYRTGQGGAYAAGFAFDTNTHEFAFMLSNTANTSFNSVITGGWKGWTLPFFGFSITSYL